MRKFALVAVAMLGLGSITPSTSQATPVAGLTAIEMLDHVEQIKKDGHKFKDHKGWKGSRHWNRGYGSGRYYGGPPPHARAYGRRARDFRYYRY
ncbi:hypothetical protein [Bosea sp. PAMC 26642]|uniref:hypothetical protein n=1 Tax=Bosea sp. (strain PAMC 26642) TaxID=1792307 RepID=UPI0007704477|nr:hypothetical protein [Bosea sp. PAMC 26642]AMJ61077.1 hypothetical protein AXW83_12960 [Bosea sp. PAMC 26642]